MSLRIRWSSAVVWVRILLIELLAPRCSVFGVLFCSKRMRVPRYLLRGKKFRAFLIIYLYIYLFWYRFAYKVLSLLGVWKFQGSQGSWLGNCRSSSVIVYSFTDTPYVDLSICLFSEEISSVFRLPLFNLSPTITEEYICFGSFKSSVKNSHFSLYLMGQLLVRDDTCKFVVSFRKSSSLAILLVISTLDRSKPFLIVRNMARFWLLFNYIGFDFAK